MTPSERLTTLRNAPLKAPHGIDHRCNVCRHVLEASREDTADHLARLRRRTFVVVYPDQAPAPRGGGL